MSKNKKLIIGFLASALFPLTSILLPLTCLYAEDVKLSTYYPSPFGNYKQVQVQNQDESTDITRFTQSLDQAGINVITDFAADAYTPGIFWSTTVNNPTRPKAGIWMYEDNIGSRLYFGTSNALATGITRGMVLDGSGQLGVGLTLGATAPAPPVALLDVNGVGVHAAGTPTAPGFAIRSDLNTGMYSSGADTLNFSTAGTQRIRVTSVGNIGVGSNYAPGTAPTNGLNGNLDVNDIFLRNGNRWASATGAGALGVAPGTGVPNANSTYNGDFNAGRLPITTRDALNRNRLISTPFAPDHVIVWRRNVGLIHMSETWRGLVNPQAVGVDAGTGFPVGGIPVQQQHSFQYADTTSMPRTYLRIDVPAAGAPENGFRVGATAAGGAIETNTAGSAYSWYAWQD